MKIRKFLPVIGLTALIALSGCVSGDKAQEVCEPELDYEETDCVLTFSAPGGIYAEEFALELTAPSGQIYYTTDGSDPTQSSSSCLYTEAIPITDREGDANVVSAVETSLFCTNYVDSDGNCYIEAPSDSAVDKGTVIRAAVLDEDGTWSEALGQTYFIGTTEEHIQGLAESCEAAGTDLAVISITMDYADLFDYDTGIYVKGALFDESYAAWDGSGETRKLLANYSARGSEWEREAHVEFYETNAEGMTCVISQNCGIRIQGNYSRSDLQKSFRLIARSDYGKKRFTYDIWGTSCTDAEGNVLDSFKTVVLRAGGNCAFTAKFNDTYWQTLVAESGLDVSTKCSRPAVVYLNGEYWGLYVLEEDYSEEYFEDHYGVDSDDVVIYKGDAETYECGYKLDEGEVPEGESEDYYLQELLDALNSYESLESDADYEAFCALVDPDSFLDYMAIEVWINNKWDWPGKNWSIWKSTGLMTEDTRNEYNDGKWRLLVYDVEFGGVSGASDATTNTVKEDNYKPLGLLDPDTSNPMVRTFVLLMSNADFRSRFCDRLSELSDTTFEQQQALAVLTDYKNIYRPLLDQFFERYPGSGSTSNAMTGGYASAKCISDFLQKRAATIPTIVNYIETH